MRIALDIDSTLHHYWDVFSALARERHGVELAYDRQATWQIEALAPEQVRDVVALSHLPEHVLSGVPYPGAVDAVRRWSRAGHYIHVTSHRSIDSHEATARWLEQIGLPFDDLHCSYDKLTRCEELGIDLLVDDSPVNLAGALDRGMRAATILHPWNRELCEAREIVCGRDWFELADALAPLLQGGLTESRRDG